MTPSTQSLRHSAPTSTRITHLGLERGLVHRLPFAGLELELGLALRFLQLLLLVERLQVERHPIVVSGHGDPVHVIIIIVARHQGFAIESLAEEKG